MERVIQKFLQFTLGSLVSIGLLLFSVAGSAQQQFPLNGPPSQRATQPPAQQGQPRYQNSPPTRRFIPTPPSTQSRTPPQSYPSQLPPVGTPQRNSQAYLQPPSTLGQKPSEEATVIVDQSQEVVQEAQQETPEAMAPDIQAIMDRGELVVAMYSVDQPPFFMKDKNGKLIGFDAELAEKMAEALGVRLRFNREANSFNQVIDIVASGKADIGISKLSYTLTRAKKVLYSKPYMTLKKTFLINRLKMAKAKGKRGADTLQKLIDHHEGTIGVIAKSSYVNFAKQLFPKATIVPLESWGLESLDIAMQGKVLAIFRDDMEILKLIRRVPDSNFHVLPVTLKEQTDPIHMILPAGKHHFLEWVNGFLRSLEKQINIPVEDLLNKYEDYFVWANKTDKSSSINTKKIKPVEAVRK